MDIDGPIADEELYVEVIQALCEARTKYLDEGQDASWSNYLHIATMVMCDLIAKREG